MPDYLNSYKNREQVYRSKLHSEGIFGTATRSIKNFIDEYDEKLPKGTGIAMAGGFLVLAAPVSLAGMAVAAGVGYAIGSKAGGVVTRRIRKWAHDELDAGSYNED